MGAVMLTPWRHTRTGTHKPSPLPHLNHRASHLHALFLLEILSIYKEGTILCDFVRKVKIKNLLAIKHSSEMFLPQKSLENKNPQLKSPFFRLSTDRQACDTADFQQRCPEKPKPVLQSRAAAECRGLCPHRGPACAPHRGPAGDQGQRRLSSPAAVPPTWIPEWEQAWGDPTVLLRQGKVFLMKEITWK